MSASRLGVAGFAAGADGVYQGHDGLRRFFREWHEAWEVIAYDFDELIDVGGERVVSIVTRHARGRASGVEVERPFALAWTVRAGKVVRLVWFLDRTEALADAGPAGESDGGEAQVLGA